MKLQGSMALSSIRHRWQIKRCCSKPGIRERVVPRSSSPDPRRFGGRRYVPAYEFGAPAARWCSSNAIRGAATRRAGMLREHPGECARQVCFRALARAKLLAALQAPAPMPGKERSGAQLCDPGIERPIAGVMDEIVGFDGV